MGIEVCYHEAGHAVVGTLLGGEVLQVTIEPDRYDDPEREGDTQILWTHSNFTKKQLLQCEVLTILAGPAAEMVYHNQPLHPAKVAQWQADWSMAEAMVAQVIPEAETRTRFLKQTCYDLFKRLQNDRCWQAISEVADELDAHDTIEGEVVSEIVRRWITG